MGALTRFLFQPLVKSRKPLSYFRNRDLNIIHERLSQYYANILIGIIEIIVLSVLIAKYFPQIIQYL